MSRFELRQGQAFELSIAREARRFTAMPHPAAEELAHAMEGRKSIVYRVRSEHISSADYAFKVMKRSHRRRSIAEICNSLGQLASLPGLSVCERLCLTKESAATSLQVWPDLEFAILMPWIRGYSWFDVLVLGKRGTNLFSQSDCLRLGANTAAVLSTLERSGLSHCDLSGGNLIVDPVSLRVELVDVEELYGSMLPPPAEMPRGTAGYQHPNHDQDRAWSDVADRFAGGILLCEILGWYDPAVRSYAFGESFFEPGELQRPTRRFELLFKALAAHGLELERMLVTLWNAAKLTDCPSIQTWQRALPASLTGSNDSPSRACAIGWESTPFWHARAGDRKTTRNRGASRPPISWTPTDPGTK